MGAQEGEVHLGDYKVLVVSRIADEGLTVALDGVPLGGKVRRDGPPR